MEASKPIRTEVQAVIEAGAFTYKNINNGYLRELTAISLMPALDIELDEARVVNDGGNLYHYEYDGMARITVHEWKRTEAVDSFEESVVEIVTRMETYYGTAFGRFRNLRWTKGGGVNATGDTVRTAHVSFTCRIG